MNRAIDVSTEMRKLTNSKPLHAAAGAGVLASQALRELPGRIARWRSEVSVASLPGRASEVVKPLPGRASEVVTTARARAVRGYDHLAVRGERVLAGKGAAARKSSGHGTAIGAGT